MFQGIDALGVFNAVSLGVFAVLVVLASVKMWWRWSLFVRTRTATPVILKRDLLLFGAIAIYAGTAIIARVFTDIEMLADEPLWVIPRTFIIEGAMAYWVWVEYHIDRARKKRNRR